jgi:hypothetical protein
MVAISDSSITRNVGDAIGGNLVAYGIKDGPYSACIASQHRGDWRIMYLTHGEAKDLIDGLSDALTFAEHGHVG